MNLLSIFGNLHRGRVGQGFAMVRAMLPTFEPRGRDTKKKGKRYAKEIKAGRNHSPHYRVVAVSRRTYRAPREKVNQKRLVARKAQGSTSPQVIHRMKNEVAACTGSMCI